MIKLWLALCRLFCIHTHPWVVKDGLEESEDGILTPYKLVVCSYCNQTILMVEKNEKK